MQRAQRAGGIAAEITENQSLGSRVTVKEQRVDEMVVMPMMRASRSAQKDMEARAWSGRK